MGEEEKLLQKVVDECIENGILVSRARRLRGQETFEPEPSLKVCLSSALSRKDVEKAGMGLKAALIKVCGSKSSSVRLRLRNWLTGRKALMDQPIVRSDGD